jgi:hypothetical protein
MKQNTSHAVMAQRFESLDNLDDFPTPPWATRALCEYLTRMGLELGFMSVWEPACGRGHMARPFTEYFGTVHASDIHPYGHGAVFDFFRAFPHQQAVEALGRREMALENSGTEERRASRVIPAARPIACPLPIWHSLPVCRISAPSAGSKDVTQDRGGAN